MYKIKKKVASFFNYSFKLVVLTSLLFSQLSLSEIFLYQSGKVPESVKIASANIVDAWYDVNWANRKEITIDHTKVINESLTNYALLFSATDNSFKSLSNAGRVGKEDGTDILFTLGDGTMKLSHEIDEYVPASGKLSAWIKIPTLSTAVDTKIYIYYGNTGASDQQDKSNVWDTNYKMVQHLSDSGTANIADSTVNANAGTKTGATEISGQIGKAQSFNGSGKITVSDSDALDFGGSDWTISFWIKSDSGTGGDVISKGGATSSNFQIKKTAGNKVWDRMKGEGVFSSPTYSWGDGTYLYTVDRYGSRIVKSLASDLSYVSEVVTWTGGSGEFSDPVGLWGDSRYVYVANSNYHCIEVFSRPDLAYVTKIGSGYGTGDDNFQYADNLWSDGTYLYILDTYNNRIVKRRADDFSFVAKIGSSGSGNDQFSRPYGIWGDGTNIYIADTSNNRIVKRLASTLAFVSKIGTSGTGNDQFSGPKGMWGDATYIYVADTGNNRIVKRLASTLAYVSQFGTLGSGDDQFNSPFGLWSDGTYLYVGDTGNARIVKRLMSNLSYVSKRGDSTIGDDLIGPSGSYNDGTYLYILDSTHSRIVKRLASDFSYVSQVGTLGTGNDQFNNPYGIWGDGTYLYIVDRYNHRIVKRLASTLAYVSQIGTAGTGNDQFSYPAGVWGDGTNLYIADTYNNRIVKRLASTLAYVSQIGAYGTGNDQFSNPSGIWSDGTNLFVVDSSNNRIVKRLASTLAYVSQVGTSGTGNDQFDYPAGVWGDGTNLYIADTYNNRIVKRLASTLAYVSQIGTLGTGNDQFYSPTSLVGDGGYLYIVDINNSRIVKRVASDLSYVSEFDSIYFAKTSSAVLDGNFNYVVVKKERVNGLVTVFNYINGLLDSQGSGYIYDYVKNASNLLLGDFLRGQLDELRISTTSRSANSIRTEYNNQSAPGTFLSLGAEEQSVHHLVITGSSSQTAGATQDVTITAKDSLGNMATDYINDKTITLSGASVVGSHIPTFTDKNGNEVNFGSSGTITFTGGVAHTTIKLYKAETAEIEAGDGTYGTSGSADYDLNITVSPADISGFGVISPTDIISETAFSLNLTALDASGNITTEVDTPTAFSVDSGAIDIASIPGTSFQDEGVYFGTVTVSEIYSDKDITLTIQNGSINQTVSLSVTGVSHFSGYVPPAKLDISKLEISSLDGRVVFANLPYDVTQIAVSSSPDFRNISWENISDANALVNKFTDAKLYFKFRTKDGGVSDVVVYDNPKNPGSSSSSGYNAGNTVAINDGDIVKTINNPDVYIIKYKNNKRYKRLVLSPSVFKSYGHLKWGNLKVISQTQLDTYITSNLVQVAGDGSLYALTPLGDTGERNIIDISKAYDADSVYEINAVDRDSYKLVK